MSQSSLSELSPVQRGFLIRLGIFGGMLAALILLGIGMFWLGTHIGPVR